MCYLRIICQSFSQLLYPYAIDSLDPRCGISKILINKVFGYYFGELPNIEKNLYFAKKKSKNINTYNNIIPMSIYSKRPIMWILSRIFIKYTHIYDVYIK